MPDDIALRDGNGTPSMLYEENGEVRRVSALKPMPVDRIFKTVNMEVTTNINLVLVQPAAGKRITVKGAAVFKSNAQGEARIFFANGKLVHKVYGTDQSGLILVNHDGQVNEALKIETTNIGNNNKMFFTVNYIEE